MKKLLLSMSLIIGFAFYTGINAAGKTPVIVAENADILSEKNTQTTEVAVTTPTPNTPSAITTVAPTPVRTVVYGDDDDEKGTVVSTPTPAPVATPKPTPTPTPTPVVPPPAPVNNGKFKNGSYTGSVADAYYGNLQVKAIISGGKLTDVQFLQYPSDRQTSLRISQRAMPTLTSEAIAAQSANVDIVSGATDISAAFQISLASALSSALN